MKNEYRYTITSWNVSSRKYGVCEVCGKEVAEIHHQIEEKKYLNPINNEYSYTRYGCNDLVGHKDCLISKRR